MRLFDDDPRLTSQQIGLCTKDANCSAPPSGHEPDCPVEAELKAEFGF